MVCWKHSILKHALWAEWAVDSFHICIDMYVTNSGVEVDVTSSGVEVDVTSSGVEVDVASGGVEVHIH